MTWHEMTWNDMTWHDIIVSRWLDGETESCRYESVKSRQSFRLKVEECPSPPPAACSEHKSHQEAVYFLYLQSALAFWKNYPQLTWLTSTYFFNSCCVRFCSFLCGQMHTVFSPPGSSATGTGVALDSWHRRTSQGPSPCSALHFVKALSILSILSLESDSRLPAPWLQARRLSCRSAQTILGVLHHFCSRKSIFLTYRRQLYFQDLPRPFPEVPMRPFASYSVVGVNKTSADFDLLDLMQSDSFL